MGAIGTGVKYYGTFTIFENGKKENILKFFKDILAPKRVMGEGNKKPILVLDNARAHLSDLVLPILNQYFEVKFMPAYSPQFNSIETLWAIVKRRFRVNLQTAIIDGSFLNEDVKMGTTEVLNATIDSIPHEMKYRVSRHNYKYVRQVISGERTVI